MKTSGAHALNPSKHEFLESVLRLEPRVAAFDCDGTLWSGDAGETFFDWEIRQGIVSPEIATAMRARYAEYKAGKVSEDEMCGEMVTMHRGMTEAVMMAAATDFMEHAFPGRIFPGMRDVVSRLQENGCERLGGFVFERMGHPRGDEAIRHSRRPYSRGESRS